MVISLDSLGLLSVRLLASWLAVQIALVGAYPYPAEAEIDSDAFGLSHEALAKRMVGQFPRFSEDYNGRVKKGGYLKELLPLSDIEATLKNSGLKWAPFTTVDYDDWFDNDEEGENEGESNAVNEPDSSPGFGDLLDKAFEDSDYPVNPGNNGLSNFRHEKFFYLRDRVSVGHPSMASYMNVLNPESGAIIFDVNFSPRYEVATNKIGNVPDLEQLSDIVYFQWLDACVARKVHPSHINIIFRSKITYQPSVDLIVKALMNAGYSSVPGWDQRAIFSMDTDQGLAILGSTHGSGPALFLIQHKAILGPKRITEVAVWCGNDGCKLDADPKSVNLNLRFVVTDP
ncbi:hypothetical protein CORC01_00636 [Colletotrichum orchidophilum]|uniref:WD domain-containing protein n=1 Tax=Colletotrichum orchidophilum TaxID=1209926 RepID=A0A1G4BSR4_9PEZI|nr:uncharacterized protein CORC01_00636 [Colletotrichum orchidophilum]OHF04297.1 hypothetical protein CORC01_00636 [Colletotrichum orchidophilum]